MESRYSFAFLDSGTGGLPYMCRLRKESPDARCVYLADTLNFPYGEKTRSEVIDCAVSAAGLIYNTFSPSVIVVACNTMSVIALDELRKQFPVPFVGTVPAVKLGATVSKNRHIGILATRRTVEDPYTERLIRDYASDCSVYKRGDGSLITYIENNLITASHEDWLEAVRPAVEEFMRNGTDTIVLACTHFVHVRSEIQELAGPGVQVIDSCDGVVRQALRVLPHNQRAAASSPEFPDGAFYITSEESAKIPYYDSLSRYFNLPFCGTIKPVVSD